jgi:hypothetical protein
LLLWQLQKRLPTEQELPHPLLPNSFGTRLNMHGFKTQQVSVDGMSFILGNIFAVGRMAAFDGFQSVSFANSNSYMASLVCSRPNSSCFWN